eukprot:gene1614-3113_t
MRPDFRENNQIRPIAAELAFVGEADGSCKFSQGNTCVSAAVYGPSQPRYNRHEVHDRAVLEIEYSTPGGSRGLESKETDACRFLKSSLSNCINLFDFPRQLIVIRVAVIRDDGSSQSTALNACVLALFDAGLPMNCSPTSVSCTIRTSISRLPAEVLLDPSLEEEDDKASAWCVFCFSTYASAPDKLLSSDTSGSVSTDTLLDAIDATNNAAKIMKNFMRKIIDSRVNTNDEDTEDQC